MYNNKSLFVDNSINRYSIGKYTEGLKNNIDGSLDIYIQHASPGKDRESNWLPSDKNSFHLILRMYLPAEEVRNMDSSTCQNTIRRTVSQFIQYTFHAKTILDLLSSRIDKHILEM